MEAPPPTDAVGGSTSATGNMAVARGKKIVVHRKKKAVQEVKQQMWISKDRFGAKRLRNIADTLAPAKRAVIEAKSAFRAFLNVAPFRIPNALIDFIAGHTTPRLREYKLRKNQMVFTRDMVRKVFGIRCGNKPVELANNAGAALDELRELYKASSNRPELATAIDILKNCAETDEAAIIRTWDLLCLATVVAPKSSNHIHLEYIGCMAEPTKTDEYTWDEHLLALAMASVGNIQKKARKLVLPKDSKKFDFWITGPFVLLGIAYMDHLDIPPIDHKFDKSVPRVCSVKSSDFVFVVQNDVDRKILENTTVFGRREFLPLSKTPYAFGTVNDHAHQPHPVEEPEVNPSALLNEWITFSSSQELEVEQVPARFKHLYEKHKAIFASDVDETIKNLAAGLKCMQAQRMAALLVDVDAATKEGAGPSVVFPSHGSLYDDESEEDEEKEQEDGVSETLDERSGLGQQQGVRSRLGQQPMMMSRLGKQPMMRSRLAQQKMLRCHKQQ